MYDCVCTRVYVPLCMYVCICLCVYMHVCMYVSVYMWVCMYVSMYVCMCVAIDHVSLLTDSYRVRRTVGTIFRGIMLYRYVGYTALNRKP